MEKKRDSVDKVKEEDMSIIVLFVGFVLILCIVFWVFMMINDSFFSEPQYQNDKLNTFLTNNQKKQLDNFNIENIYVEKSKSLTPFELENEIKYTIGNKTENFSRNDFFYYYEDERAGMLRGRIDHFPRNNYIIENNQNSIVFLSSSEIEDDDVMRYINRADAIINAVESNISQKAKINEILSSKDYYEKKDEE